jgi:hypothetical protein
MLHCEGLFHSLFHLSMHDVAYGKQCSEMPYWDWPKSNVLGSYCKSGACYLAPACLERPVLNSIFRGRETTACGHAWGREGHFFCFSFHAWGNVYVNNFFIFWIFQHINLMYIFYEQFMCISFSQRKLMHIIVFRMLIYMYKFFEWQVMYLTLTMTTSYVDNFFSEQQVIRITLTLTTSYPHNLDSDNELCRYFFSNDE